MLRRFRAVATIVEFDQMGYDRRRGNSARVAYSRLDRTGATPHLRCHFCRCWRALRIRNDQDRPVGFGAVGAIAQVRV